MKQTRPQRFDVLVCYDVNTTTFMGEARLRRVAKACEGFGRRVQYSVFECSLTTILLDKLRVKLLDIIDSDTDSLRIYYLYGPRENRIEVHGRDKAVDFSGPLIV